MNIKELKQHFKVERFCDMNAEGQPYIKGEYLLWDINEIDGAKVDRKFLDRIYVIKSQDFGKFKELAANGTAVVPTINGSYKTTYLDTYDFSKDDYLKYLQNKQRREEAQHDTIAAEVRFQYKGDERDDFKQWKDQQIKQQQEEFNLSKLLNNGKNKPKKHIERDE